MLIKEYDVIWVKVDKIERACQEIKREVIALDKMAEDKLPPVELVKRKLNTPKARKAK